VKHSSPKGLTVTRFGVLKRVFYDSSISERDCRDHISAQIARISILYEDLRIELFGMDDENNYEDLDRLGKPYRTVYFLRRSFATALELCKSIAELNGSKNFRLLRSSFKADELQHWTNAVVALRATKDRVNLFRNNSGGHIDVGACSHAIENLNERQVGKLEIRMNVERTESEVLLEYAGDLVAGVIFAGRPRPDADEELRQMLRDTGELMAEIFQHAMVCINLIVGSYLFPRFGH